MSVIKDGTGTDVLARVNSENKLFAIADIVSREHSRAVSGFRFAGRTGILNLPAGFDGPVLFLKNTNNDLPFHLTKVIIGWNGGNTNHNRAMETTGMKAAIEPTGARTAVIPGNTNFGSNRTAEITAWRWDNATGTVGMTGGTGGVTIVNNILGQGRTDIPFTGSTILVTGSTFCFSLKPEEAGNATVSFIGYFDTEGMV